MATKSEFLNQLVEDNDLDRKEDIFEMPLGGKKVAIITRTGIEKIQYNNNIEVKFSAEVLKEDFAVMKATASKYGGTLPPIGDGLTIETYGSALMGQGGNCRSNYVAEMAEKRALARAVLKLSGAYKHGVYAEDESDDFKQRNKEEDKDKDPF
jgi:hypothetical protein